MEELLGLQGEIGSADLQHVLLKYVPDILGANLEDIVVGLHSNVLSGGAGNESMTTSAYGGTTKISEGSKDRPMFDTHLVWPDDVREGVEDDEARLNERRRRRALFLGALQVDTLSIFIGIMHFYSFRFSNPSRRAMF